MFCPIHKKMTFRKCAECSDHEVRSERAKRGYVNQNPYCRGHKSIGIPDYGVIMTLEELKEIPYWEWTEDHWTAKRIRVAEKNQVAE